jgi:hypothetical protein
MKKIKNKKLNKNRVNNNIVTFEENIKIDKIKKSIEPINKISYYRLYSPLLSCNKPYY